MRSEGNGTRAFGGVIALVALLTGMAAIIRPIQQQVDFLDRRISADDVREREDTATIGKMSERFKEVETQFRSLRELVDTRIGHAGERTEKLEEWLDWWHKTVPGLDARQNTRLEALEREHKWATHSSASQP